MDQKQRLKLEEHLWILSRLLSTKYDGNTTSRNRGYQLLRYVVATCYPKILLRLNHAVGSRPYLNSLHAVAKIGFKYKRSGHKKIKPGLSGQYLEKEIEEAKEYDESFLRFYVLKDGKERQIGLHIPRIVEKAHLLATSESVEIYDKDTCSEFGLLFDHLLVSFESAIWAMEYFRPVLGSNLMSPQRASEAHKHKSFGEALDAAMTVGHALLRLSRGLALPQYLRNIESLLETHNPSLANTSKSVLEKGVGPKEQKHDQCLKAQLSNRALEVDEGPNKQQYNLDAAQLDEDSEQQERDQDLEAVGANEKVWQRHLDWLKVILSHYGAVRTLVVYVNGPHFRPYKAILMRIMNYPPSSRQLLSWKTLLNPAQNLGFPEISLKYFNDDIENKIIVHHLDEACQLFCGEFLQQLSHGSVGKGTDLKALYDSLKKLSTCNVKSLSAPAEAALKWIDVEESQTPALLYSIKNHEEFIASIQPLRHWKRFFSELKEQSGEARIQIGFKGAMHCEVCITSLLHYEVLGSNRFKAIEEKLKVNCIITFL